MLRRLKKYRFKESDLSLPEVRNFYCGNERWEREVAEWIKSRSGENSVLEDIKRFATEVWLHRSEEGILVGYSSFGLNECTWPPKSKWKEIIGYIPFLGVQKEFQSEPKEADLDDRFAYQILDELIEYAATKRDRFPVIMGSVDRENKRCLKFLKHRGFEDIQSPRTDWRGVIYDRVALVIEDLVVDPVRGWTASAWIRALPFNLCRDAAIEALCQMKKGAIPALTRALKDGNNRIRELAAPILEKIDPGAARRAGFR